MNRRTLGVIGGTATLTLLATAAVQGSAFAAPPANPGSLKSTTTKHKADDRPDHLAQRDRAMTAHAKELVARGEATPQKRGGSSSVKVAPGQWVEYETEDTGQILSMLVEFGDKEDPRFPGTKYEGLPAGPTHNNIPKPDRTPGDSTYDNSTYWVDDFDREHYLDMFFKGLPEQGGESFRDSYKEMSSGRYLVDGDVTDWVQVPYHEASYGLTESNQDMTRFIDDTAEAWLDKAKADGVDPAEYLSQFDQWDRYDHDGDGNFDEPDGYIDHFQAIHAGEGEEAGAPEWAIWSHRWAVNPSAPVGPEGAKQGGIEIGDTGYWIRDYTTEPENGGLGVFAHEFGHDLGLPDLYDTAGGDNGTAFWTLMSSGSWLNHGGEAIGTTPNHMGAWEKLQLGWLDYETVEAGESGKYQLGPAEHATKKDQALLVNLPPHTVTTDYGDAPEGSNYFYSGRGNHRTATMTSPSFTVPDGGQLTAQVRYAIEDDWDYAFAEISTDGGASFTPVETNLSTSTDPNNQNDGYGITGCSGEAEDADPEDPCEDPAWVDLTADLNQYAGQDVQLRFRMFNDAGYNELGYFVDDIAVGDALTEGAEDGAADWTLDGFSVVENGEVSHTYNHFYIAENRQYVGYDTTLEQGPYNFGWGGTQPNRVERFPYQNGLLVSYWNTQYADNNTSQHPGGGLILPVDARAEALRWDDEDGTVARNRIQAFDATFGTEATDPISLHREYIDDANGNGKFDEGELRMSHLNVGRQAPVRTFDDSDPTAYWDKANPGGSVIVGGTGTTIGVHNSTKNGKMMVTVGR
ncbi:MAG TPA: immune inhibitor A domain-containing protein [Nocardioidaceae bacterium]|nr:immune inhibitor A domain-containing protein [Nocardioidaceae bacterium]